MTNVKFVVYKVITWFEDASCSCRPSCMPLYSIKILLSLWCGY